MLLKWKETSRFLFRYLVGYLIVCVVIFVGMRLYKERNFSPQKLETMFSEVSKQRDVTDDPCKYQISGEPATAKLEFVKVNIFCNSASKSINSMDLRAIKDKTAAGAIKELARINGFPVEISAGKIVVGKRSDLKNDAWICLQNRKKIVDFSEALVPKGTINCFNGPTFEELITSYEIP